MNTWQRLAVHLPREHDLVVLDLSVWYGYSIVVYLACSSRQPRSTKGKPALSCVTFLKVGISAKKLNVDIIFMNEACKSISAIDPRDSDDM